MQEKILDTYNKILEYTLNIKAAIEEEKWERVNLLASHREKLFQETNAFLMGKNEVEESLKKKIFEILTEIKLIDDANIEAINQSKVALDKSKVKMKVGHKMLKAYQSMPDFYKGRFDKST
ncbi:MAG: hypothetical protein AB1782_20970 [Cyanobacteriota bacterium]